VRRFEFVLYAATFASHTPITLALFGVAGSSGVAAGLALATATTMLLRGRLHLAYDDRPISDLRRAFERAYYTLWVAPFFASFAAPFALLLALLFHGDAFTALSLACALATIAAIVAVWFRPRTVRIRRLTLPITDLPAGLDGLTIAHLSDLHIGSMWPPEVARQWVKTANGLGADVVALTGDYVTSGVRFQSEAASLLGDLIAPLGVFAVLGNHDDFGGGALFREALACTRVRLLANEHVEVEKNGSTFAIAGVDDLYTRRADVERTLANAPAGVRIVLAHDPRLAGQIAERGASVVLSGHTHWGQIGVPFASERVNLGRAIYRTAAGRIRIGKAWLYVHAGLGTTGPPIRFGVAPEIVLLRCVRAR
jgi:uncharacterized protein